MAKKNQANAKQHPEAEFLLFEFFHILHPHYHPKRWIWKIDHIDTTLIGPRSRNGHKSSKYKKSLTIWWCLDVLNKVSATFECQFMKKLTNTEAELKKALPTSTKRKRLLCARLSKFLSKYSQKLSKTT